MVDVPSKELENEHPVSVHVTGKARILPQGQLPLHFLPRIPPGSRLHLMAIQVFSLAMPTQILSGFLNPVCLWMR